VPERAPTGTGNPASAQAVARTKLRQARALLAKGNHDAAEALAKEAERLAATYAAGEDTPGKVLDDLAKARVAALKPGDVKGYMAAARGALARGDLDQAEQWAHEADKASSAWTSWQLWGDSPAKVLKDVQAERAKLAAQKKPPVEPQATAKAEVAPIPDKTDQARQLVKQGRKALQEGDTAKAKQMAHQARALKPELNWWDDTPEKVLAEVQRLETAKQSSAAREKEKEKENQVADSKAVDPRTLLKQARDLYAAGQLDEAEKMAQGVRTSSSTRWGLFEDSPEKLLQDITKVRTKRNQEESVRLLAEARKLYEQGNYDEAESKANRAARLHGKYSLWDLGDRPQKLVAEIDAARSKNRKQQMPPVPATEVAKQDPEKVTPPRKPSPAVAEAPKRSEDKPVPQVAATTPPPAPVPSRPVLPPASATAAQPNRSVPPAPRADATPAVAAARQPTVAAPPTAPVVDTGKQNAQRLLAEARLFQKEGRLAEARQKVLEAQKVGASFTPGEDRPEAALLELAALCDKRIDSLKQQAGDYLHSTNGDPSRYQKAETNLVQARQLASAFGFDTQEIDEKLAVVHRTRNQALAATGTAALPVPPPSAAGQTGQKPVLPAPPIPARVSQAQATWPAPAESPAAAGKSKLDQARLELRKGETENARRLAAEVYSGPYGLQVEAENMLRSIDAEEFNQRILAANRAYDAGRSSFHRREFAQASTIFRTLDMQLLSAEKQAKLKELMQLPEMQQRSLNQVAAKSPAHAQGTEPGRARVGDLAPPAAASAEESFAKQVQAMQEVKFQKLRQEGLQAQSEAGKRFQAGETDRALEILQEFSARLQDADLEPDRQNLLRRPIEARLQQFKTLKVQRDFERLQKGQHETASAMISRELRAEENKKQQIATLMKQAHAFFKEGKYPEAEMYAMRAQELDPDDPVPGAMIYTARIQANQVAYSNIKRDKEAMFVAGLDDAESVGPAVTSSNPLAFDTKVSTMNRSRKGTEALSIGTKGEREQQIERRLLTPINLNFSQTSLRQVLDDLRDMTGINIVPDQVALDESGVSLERPVTMKLEGITLKSALNLILRQVRLTYVVKDEVLQVTTENHARGKLVTKIYSVPDLVLPIQDSTMPVGLPMSPRGGESNLHINGVQPYLGLQSLANGQPVSSNAAAPGLPGAASMTSQPQVSKQSPKQTIEDALISLIKNTVSPMSWNDMGGPGTIEYYPIGLALAITQTPDIQEQIAELLAALRRLQDQEVSVEVRFITIAESFFERIGLDFNVNIKTNRNTTRYEPQIITQQFAPFGFINDFNPRNFVTGLIPGGTTPPGAFTSDLDIPITSSSFAQAIPPFGAFPNIPGGNGGLELGLAFLSDIQVFLFMEAAQGDQRTNVMQAPKLTLFNGQTSTLTVTDAQFFVTSVTVFQAGGQVVFVPQNNLIPTGGVTLTIQAVISADRRFVRMSLTPSLTNLVSAVIPLFPTTTFITPVFESGAQGQPIPFTQFLQQPAINTISVSTTVSVPDGGTVLMGGLKRLSEGRNEFGPPILSKVPYVNRLFKNVGYGREAVSLLLMVTPRIIINEEEEARQVPGLLPPGAQGP
jgi:type II secretory pathway component GspD/PulD (secretin)/tetratricopeptide (TPR) repeat protein